MGTTPKKVAKLKDSDLKEVHPQTVVRGNIIRSTVSDTDEVVTDVVISYYLGNGTVEQFRSDDMVRLVPAPEAPVVPKEA